MKRWSFALQVYFLSNRFRNHKSITEGTDSVVLDRVIYEDAEIFARNLHEIAMMEERDYRNYVSLYHVMTEFLHPPDVLIYLRASIETLTHQISLRGRDFERSIQPKYLQQLNTHYEQWISSYSLGKLLTVDSNRLDFVNNEEDLKEILEEMQNLLQL
jgi:deoxyadenosine/deoxycytidine kinase